MRKYNFLLPVLLLSLSVFFYACSSVGYEIEETADENAVNNETQQQTEGTQEMQRPTGSTESVPDNTVSKTNTSAESRKVYTIQIGAFSNETSARQYSARVVELNYDIRIEKEDGLCKIRLGRFTSTTDAAGILETLKNSGYTDSFLLESK